MPRRFEADKHCGAIAKNGQPCTRPRGSGTDHAGVGHCFLHDSPATGTSEQPPAQAGPIEPIAPAAERRSSQSRPLNQNARKHGIYSRVLTGNAATRYRAVQEFHPSELVLDNFYLLQSKLLGLIENDVSFSRQDEILLQAATMLVEAEELTEDYLECKLRPALLNMPVDRLAAIANSTANLAASAHHLHRLGALEAQNQILMGFLRSALRSGTRTTKEEGLRTIELLKLEGGLPVEEISAMFTAIAQAEREAELKSAAADEAAIDADVDLLEDEWEG